MHTLSGIQFNAMKPTSILVRNAFLFVLGAVLFSCTHLRQPPPARPTILLLDDADKEWSRLPSEVRESFKKHVHIKKTTVDQIVQNPQDMEFVIGFLCSDLTSFDPIRYLSFDSIHQVEAEASLHLFRRRTFGHHPEDHLRGFFLYLSSLSDQICWGPPPSRAKVRHKRFKNELLIKVLENTLIGDFKPSANDPFSFLEEVETLTRKAGIDFDHPIFVIPDEFHDHIKKYAVRPYPSSLGVSPDWSIMELLQDHSGTLGLYFHIHDGVFNLTPIHDRMRDTHVYRINPGQLARWIEWANAMDPLLSAAKFKEMSWLEEREFRINEEVDIFGIVSEPAPFNRTQQPEDFDRSTLSLEKIAYYLSLPRDSPDAKDDDKSMIFQSFSPFIFHPNVAKDSTIADRIIARFLQDTPSHGPVSWYPPDQLHIKLRPLETHYPESLLYLIHTRPPDR